MSQQLPPHRARSEQKQHDILDYIKRVSDTPPYYPTLAEIQRALGFRHRSNVEYHVNQLARQGKIKILRDLPRGIRLSA